MPNPNLLYSEFVLFTEILNVCEVYVTLKKEYGFMKENDASEKDLMNEWIFLVRKIKVNLLN